MTRIPKERTENPPLKSSMVLGLLGTLSTLGLLTAPLPTAWAGLVGLIVLAVGTFWTRRRFGELSACLPALLFVAGALVGLYVTVRPDTAEIRFFGILAGLSALLTTTVLAQSPTAARRIVVGMLIAAVMATFVLFLLVSPFVSLERLPGGLTSWLAALDPFRQAILDQDDVLQRYRLRASGLGTMAAFGLALALGPLLAGPSRRTRVIAVILIGYFVAFLLIAGNRGAMLSAALVTLILVLSRNRWLLSAGLAASGVVLVLVSGLVRLSEEGQAGRLLRLLSGPATDPGSVFRRVEFWDNSMYLLGDFPLTGVGLGL
ncbi:MAG TPA: hypothetical protein VHX16_01720, partial [Chloroflexota bacterium]|nr:hypothetical protein [Chloroflexota bacterium]